MGVAMPTVDGGESNRLVLAWGVAVAAHAAVLGYALVAPNKSAVEQTTRYVPVEVVEIAPPAPPPPEPKKVVDLTAPKARAPSAAPVEAPPPPPVFGLGRKSFGTTGSFAVRTGNTVGIRPEDSAQVDGEIVAVHEVTVMPSIKSQPSPTYPPALRSAGIEGDVVLELLIDAAGNVVAAAIVESTNAAFDQAALDAGRQVKFVPARQGGAPVAVKIRFPIKFRLR